MSVRIALILAISGFLYLLYVGSPLPAKLPVINKPLEDFKLIDLKMNQKKFSNLIRRPSIVMFWSLGCPICVSELKDMESLSVQLNDVGLGLFAVNLDGPGALSGILSLLKRKGIRYLNVVIALEDVPISSFPTFVVIDKNMVVQKVFIGSQPLSVLKGAVFNIVR